MIENKSDSQPLSEAKQINVFPLASLLMSTITMVDDGRLLLNKRNLWFTFGRISLDTPDKTFICRRRTSHKARRNGLLSDSHPDMLHLYIERRFSFQWRFSSGFTSSSSLVAPPHRRIVSVSSFSLWVVAYTSRDVNLNLGHCQEDNVAGQKKDLREYLKIFLLPTFEGHSISSEILTYSWGNPDLFSRDLDLVLKHLHILDTRLRAVIICRTFSDVLINILFLLAFLTSFAPHALLLHYSRSIVIKIFGVGSRWYWKINRHADNDTSFILLTRD